jgi:hypothetical protein
VRGALNDRVRAAGPSEQAMTDLIEKRFRWLAEQLPGDFRGRVNLCVTNVAEFLEPELVP